MLVFVSSWTIVQFAQRKLIIERVFKPQLFSLQRNSCCFEQVLHVRSIHSALQPSLHSSGIKKIKLSLKQILKTLHQNVIAAAVSGVQ